ncbi:hypothetical protein F4679DRAFT_587630 [Xylaria curta]|nr:hypothetical protein F4679DRAFT_587630 [Xylaria curta]
MEAGEASTEPIRTEATITKTPTTRRRPLIDTHTENRSQPYLHRDLTDLSLIQSHLSQATLEWVQELLPLPQHTPILPAQGPMSPGHRRDSQQYGSYAGLIAGTQTGFVPYQGPSHQLSDTCCASRAQHIYRHIAGREDAQTPGFEYQHGLEDVTETPISSEAGPKPQEVGEVTFEVEFLSQDNEVVQQQAKSGPHASIDQHDTTRPHRDYLDPPDVSFFQGTRRPSVDLTSPNFAALEDEDDDLLPLHSFQVDRSANHKRGIDDSLPSRHIVGQLDKLPLEVVTEILLALDVPTLTAFRRVNP